MYGTKFKFLFTSIATACLLAACGGGGGNNTEREGNTGEDPDTDPPATASIAGVWTGSSTMETGNVNRPTLKWDSTAIGLPDGRFYLISSQYYNQDDAPDRNSFGTLLVGRGTVTDNSFSFSGGQEFSFESDWLQRPAALTATYQSQQTLQGSISYSNGNPRNFTTSYSSGHGSAASMSELAYNNPNINSIQGTFYKSRPEGGVSRYPVTLLVGENGNLTTRYPATECALTGNLTPRTDRKLFDVTITFTSNNCPYASGTTLSGVAFQKDSVPTTTHPNVTLGRFHLAAASANQDQGVVFAQILQN